MGTPHRLDDDLLRAEGDVNVSAHRRAWRAQVEPASEAILAADEGVFLHQSLSTPCLDAIKGCDGIYLTLANGRRIMDFHGNSAHQVGYGHPRVISAIRRQLDELCFCPRRYTNWPAVELARKLVDLTDGHLSRALFAPGGTAAIGIALKLARYATGRHKTISMWNSFHGASLDAISVGGEALFRDGLGPLLPGCFHVPWPADAADAELVEQRLTDEGDIGAVIAEPMRCTTVEKPSNAYWERVRQLCDLHGTLLIFDEIPLALGRTGKMFCYEHTTVVPDIVVIGKGLGGGVFPMAAVLARENLDIAPDRAVGHYTHEKSPVGAAAALATIEVIEQDGLLDHARRMGEYAVARLRDFGTRCPVVGEIRGLGLSLAVELINAGMQACAAAERIMYECLSHGLSFKVSDGNVLTLTPPLVISQDQLADALSILEAAILQVSDELKTD